MNFSSAPKADRSERFNVIYSSYIFSCFPLCLFFPGHKSQREDLDSVLFILEVIVKPFSTVNIKNPWLIISNAVSTTVLIDCPSGQQAYVICKPCFQMQLNERSHSNDISFDLSDK